MLSWISVSNSGLSPASQEEARRRRRWVAMSSTDTNPLEKRRKGSDQRFFPATAIPSPSPCPQRGPGRRHQWTCGQSTRSCAGHSPAFGSCTRTHHGVPPTPASSPACPHGHPGDRRVMTCSVPTLTVEAGRRMGSPGVPAAANWPTASWTSLHGISASSWGFRLPILQGGTFSFLAPSLAMLSLPSWKCPEWTFNATQVDADSPEFTEEWQKRLRELQGAVMVASCVQILVGFSGLLGILMRFIGPLTIAPTISLVALPLFDSAGNDAGSHWGIAAITIFLIVLFSQYLKNVALPVPVKGQVKKCHSSKFYLFQVFPVLLALCISWLICFVLTVTNTLPSAPTAYGYGARTDIKGNVLSQAPWFRIPYPGQWGLPTVSLAGVFGIIAGVISSMVESVGDYYACARLVGAPAPPQHAINRGIGIEGLGCLLAGIWGTGNGTTSYSENVGALGITRVGSRMVIVAAGCVLLLMGVFGKIGAAFATIPPPVIGGMFMVMFGVIVAVGISNLQYVDMNSSRNLFVFGFSIYCGLVIPNWVNKNPEKLQTGILQLDQVIQVLLTTGMFVGGFMGFLLDNTIPGSQEERGLLIWNQLQEESEETVRSLEVYRLPFGIGTKFCTSSCVRYLPFWPRLEHGGKGEEGVTQLTLCPRVVTGEPPKYGTETRM
ncbi:solute carrier family 23 member 1-like isoform X2 [Choloepus didactylus]|uniref:solute carrier family 23 member 1-like isoform X2 n=1 Tax=Choloepus didactylus TaxID=27675 RepID=UPI0018A01436|nr:solute carrier family 23 member 1-like isoform X2 [Choloepus didactylus]